MDGSDQVYNFLIQYFGIVELCKVLSRYIEIIEKQLHCVDTEKSSTFPFNLNANLTHNSKVSDAFMHLMYILPQNQSCFIHFNFFKFTVIFIQSSIEGARFYLPSSPV